MIVAAVVATAVAAAAVVGLHLKTLISTRNFHWIIFGPHCAID